VRRYRNFEGAFKFIYMKLLISLYDHSGNQSLPYRQNGWFVKQVELKHGIDILTWDYKNFYADVCELLKLKGDYIEKIGIICPTPCTDFAISGARHFARKDNDGSTQFSQKLVQRNKDIIDFFDATGLLQFWQVENPMSRIHTLNPWLGKVKFKFNPCDFYYSVPNPGMEKMILFFYAKHKKFEDLTKKELSVILELNAYNKQTWLWGKFNDPVKRPIIPPFKENPGWKLYGGKSERTKELRSITPIGFCWAFYEANH